MNPITFVFEVLGKLFGLIFKSITVIETNVDSLDKLSQVGNAHASIYHEEAIAELNVQRAITSNTVID